MSSPKKKIKKTVKTRPAAAAKTGKTRSAARTVAKPPRKSEAGTTAKAAKAVKTAADDVRKAARPTAGGAAARKTAAKSDAGRSAPAPSASKKGSAKPAAGSPAVAGAGKAARKARVIDLPTAAEKRAQAKAVDSKAAAKVADSKAARTGGARTSRQQQIASVSPPLAASASVAASASATKPPAASAPVLKTSSTSDRTQVTEKKIDTAAAPKIKSEPVKTPAVRPARPTNQRQGFKTNEFIVYPAHGVGQIVGIEEQEVAGFKLELFVISFAKDKMTLKVPTPKAPSVGMRKLAEANVVRKALDTLTGRARIKRTMWSRRAQEYEAKINSGDLVAIAEVVRDLYRSEAQPEQSYSERQLYEAALDRMAREIAAVNKLIESESLKLIDSQLQKGPRRGAKADADAEEVESDGGVDEAA